MPPTILRQGSGKDRSRAGPLRSEPAAIQNETTVIHLHLRSQLRQTSDTTHAIESSLNELASPVQLPRGHLQRCNGQH